MASGKLCLRTQILLLFLLSFVAQGAPAQEPAPAADAEVPAVIVAIPLEDVSERAEVLSKDLQEMLPGEEDSQERRRGIGADLEKLKSDIASRIESAKAALAGDRTTARLRDLEQ